MDGNLFFSYGHDECREYVKKIKEIFKKEGFEVFLDEEILREGEDWEYKLEKAIEKSDKVVFFITPYSARRPDGYCLNELSYALQCKKEIIPVIFKFEKPPLSINRLQFIDMQDVCQKESEELLREKTKRVVRVLKGIEKLDFEGIQARVIKDLDPVDFTSDFTRHKNFIGREWIIERIDEWINKHPSSRLFWITAEAGYGKSAIASFLAQRYEKVVGAYFCSYNAPYKNDPINFIKTLAFHFQSQIEGYFDLIKDVSVKNKSAKKLFDDLIANPLKKLSNKKRDYIFIIDGLDEVLGEEEGLLKLIGSRDFREKLPDFIKIVVTSRAEPQLKSIFDGLNYMELRVDEEENMEDCKEFIKKRLKDIKREDKIEDKEFIDTILDKSQANMLYLTQLFDMMERGILDMEKADSFPNTLNGIFREFFERMEPDINRYDEKIAPILEIITAYGEWIPKILLQDILKLSKKSLKRELNRLGSMIEEDEGWIALYHKALKEWLIMENNDKYFVDIKEGERKIESFLNSLTKESYKEEYLEFFYFNKMLIERFYKKENSVEKFFDLIDGKNIEKEIKLLHRLGWHFNEYNEMRIAIPVRKRVLDKTFDLYEKDKSRWAELYTASLNNLAYTLQSTGEVQEAIKLLKRLWG